MNIKLLDNSIIFKPIVDIFKDFNLDDFNNLNEALCMEFFKTFGTIEIYDTRFGIVGFRYSVIDDRIEKTCLYDQRIRSALTTSLDGIHCLSNHFAYNRQFCDSPCYRFDDHLVEFLKTFDMDVSNG